MLKPGVAIRSASSAAESSAFRRLTLAEEIDAAAEARAIAAVAKIELLEFEQDGKKKRCSGLTCKQRNERCAVVDSDFIEVDLM